jgi:hypothetical protein
MKKNMIQTNLGDFIGTKEKQLSSTTRKRTRSQIEESFRDGYSAESTSGNVEAASAGESTPGSSSAFSPSPPSAGMNRTIEERYIQYVNSLQREAEKIQEKCRDGPVEKYVTTPKGILIGFMNELKTSPNQAFSLTRNRENEIAITNEVLDRLLQEPLYKIIESKHGVKRPQRESTEEQLDQYRSASDTYLEEAQMNTAFGKGTFMEKLYVQMWRAAVESGRVKSIAEHLERVPRMKNVERVCYRDVCDFLREPNPANPLERPCCEANPVTGKTSCRSFAAGGFVCREWILPSKRNQPLPEERNWCLFCLRSIVTELFTRLRSRQVPALFVLHDHCYEEDMPGEYCSDGMLKQTNGFYGLVGPFPSHQSSRYTKVRFGRRQGTDLFVPILNENEDLTNYAQQQLLYGWVENANFFTRSQVTDHPR